MPDESQTHPNAMKSYLNSWYWVKATMGEAYLGMEQEENAKPELEQAYEKAPQTWMKSSTEEQLNKLRRLMQDSPLKYINKN